MALGHAPSIIMDGLVFYVDAANPRFYPGSGTSVFNLNSTGIGATLVGGITYSSANSGSFVLNGTSHYINIPNSAGYGISTESFTMILFAKPTIPLGTFISFLSNRQLTGFNNGILITTDFQANRELYLRYQLNTASATNQYYSGTIALSRNNYNHIAMVVNRTNNTLTSYLNGALDASYSITGLASIASTHSLEIGRDEAYVPDSRAWMIGNLSIFQIYNRPLLISEIKTNYNATNKRYGL